MQAKQNEIKLGLRWDDPGQTSIHRRIYNDRLISYLEVNFPWNPDCDLPFELKPESIGIPIFVHNSHLGLASAFPLDMRLASHIKDMGHRFNSPWIGEHLSWLAASEIGSHGYVINPVYNSEWLSVAVENIQTLKRLYERPVAIELGPQYFLLGSGFRNEMEFLSTAAHSADCSVILDLTHAFISDHNLGRQIFSSLSSLNPESVVEIHIAGCRFGAGNKFIHDDHSGSIPKDIIFELSQCVKDMPNLRAVTYECGVTQSESEVRSNLNSIQEVICAAG